MREPHSIRPELEGPQNRVEMPWRTEELWTAPARPTVDVWSVDLARSQGEHGLLDEAERARAERFVLDRPRLQFSRARAGLRRILARSLERDAREIAFELGPHGRPSLPRSLAVGPFGGIDFNLSHSGELALVAVAFSNEPVQLGVDVEEERERRPLDRLAERFFAPSEVDQYRSTAASERAAAFYRGWTRKEAYLKAWGTGLTFSSRRFALDLGEAAADPVAPGGRELLRSTEMPEDDGRGWCFVDFMPGPAVRGALCYRGPVEEVRTFQLSPPVPSGEEES